MFATIIIKNFDIPDAELGCTVCGWKEGCSIQKITLNFKVNDLSR